ncbi:uncharacterized protein LOC135359069 [Latimeria chalumnae]|uniref:uncharacterized protein LOC135359069 n=1 Tax=Latimeria chalumnae TaxID=7897 RepID=UPI00313B7E70
MLGPLLQDILARLNSLESGSQAPPILPTPGAALSTFSPAPEFSLLAAALEPTALMPDLALAPVLDPRMLGSSLRVIAKSPDPAQAGPSGTVSKQVPSPIVTSEEEDSGEGWCEVEGVYPGEVSDTFYTSTGTDSEQGVRSGTTAQDASFWGLVEKMAGVLALELSSASEADQSRFMQLLQGRSVRSRLQVPLHDIVPTMLRDICRTPFSVVLANKWVDRRYLVPEGEGAPLASHLSAESTVASVANDQARTQRVFSSVPPDQDVRKWDTLDKKVYSSASLGVQISSYLAHFSQYNYDLWGEVAHLAELVLEDEREDIRRLAADGVEVSSALMQGALDSCDTAARGVAEGVSIRRQTWLQASGFLSEVQHWAADLPFSGGLLFGERTESALQQLKEAKSTVPSLAPLRQTPRPRLHFCPQGGARRPFPQGQRSVGLPSFKWRHFTAPGKGASGGEPPGPRDPKPQV